MKTNTAVKIEPGIDPDMEPVYVSSESGGAVLIYMPKKEG